MIDEFRYTENISIWFYAIAIDILCNVIMLWIESDNRETQGEREKGSSMKHSLCVCEYVPHVAHTFLIFPDISLAVASFEVLI